MLRGVDQFWNAFAAQLLVLLVYLPTVETGVDQSVLDPALLDK